MPFRRVSDRVTSACAVNGWGLKILCLGLEGGKSAGKALRPNCPVVVRGAAACAVMLQVCE